MKTIKLCSAMAGLLLLTSSLSFASPLQPASNEVKITPVENLFLGKTAEKVWTVNFSDKEKPVTITLHQVRKTKEFIVRSEYFEVAYVSNKHGFGATQVPRSMRKVPVEINSAVLNLQQIENQKMLTPNQVSEEFALNLIANYLPDLLNNNYKHLLF
jgi:hypothetical protein